MKKIILLIAAFSLLTTSCKNEVLAKPNNLIDKDKMVAIIYDLALLEAAKTQTTGTVKYPRATQYIKEKYKIDSITFAKSTQYYASNIKEYKKMYDEVKAKLTAESTKLNGGKPVDKLPEGGVVK